MKTLLRRVIWIGFLFAVCGHCCAAEWSADYDAALKKARREGKAVMLDFTGSDWCHWCMKLKSEVFDQPEFNAFADANLILVEVDFPHRWALSPAQQEANNGLAQKYGIRGFPTIVVLNSDGEKIGTSGYQPGGPKVFIASLERMPGLNHSNSPDVSSPPHRAPELLPIPPVAPIQYGELALKGISGSASRRMALINNESFLTGETAKVKVKDGKVEVTCKEIRADSVLLTVNGKPVELKLPHP